MPETPPGRPRRTLFVLVPLIVLLAPVAYSVVSSLVSREVPSPPGFLEMPAPEHEKCVEETAYMRFHHWELLRAVREEVVRYGQRENPGLARCKECHTSRERFCNRCHDATSLYPDCWGCHYYP